MRRESHPHRGNLCDDGKSRLPDVTLTSGKVHFLDLKYNCWVEQCILESNNPSIPVSSIPPFPSLASQSGKDEV